MAPFWRSRGGGTVFSVQRRGGTNRGGIIFGDFVGAHPFEGLKEMAEVLGRGDGYV